MSGQQVGSIVGAVIGNAILPGVGGFIGGAIGGAVGSQFDPAIQGPRLQDLKAQSSEYGRPIPIIAGGTIALQGNIIWASDLVEVERDISGKGGPEVLQYSYFANFAVAVCEGPVQFGRIWAGPDKRLIWNGGTLEGEESGAQVRFYSGDEDQLPDALIESYMGVGNVPAYRGTAYVVFENFPVEKDANRIPFLTIEVGTVDSQSCPIPELAGSDEGGSYFMSTPAPEKIADVAGGSGSTEGRVFQDSATGHIFYTYSTGSGEDTQWWMGRVSPTSGDLESPLLLATGLMPTRIAWDGNGTAVSIHQLAPEITTIDLVNWTTSATVGLTGIVCDLSTCASVPVPLWDVVYDQAEGQFRYLAYTSSLSGFDAGVSAIEGVDIAAGRAGYTDTLAWGSGGARSGGGLISMGDDGSAAWFPAESANHASAPVEWEGYDTKRRRLVSFSNSAYSTHDPLTDSWEFVGTSEFAQTVPGFSGGVVYSPQRDMFYVATPSGILMFDPNKLTPESWPPEDCILYNPNYRQAYEGGGIIPWDGDARLFLLPEEPEYLGVSLNGDILKIRIGLGITEPHGVPLSQVVLDLSLRAGLTESQVDVSQLANDTVDGYAIASQMDIKSAIDALRPVYFFDAVESGAQIKFVKRGGAIAAVIDDDDLGAYESGSEPVEDLETTRIMDEELPRIVTVRYLLEATKYDTATKIAKRLVGNSGSEASMDLPLVLKDTKAQEVAEVNLHGPWVGRLTYRFSVPRKYAGLEPTDIVVVKGHTMRIVTIKQTDGRYQVEAVHDDANVYVPNVVVTETQPPPPESVETLSATILELM